MSLSSPIVEKKKKKRLTLYLGVAFFPPWLDIPRACTLQEGVSLALTLGKHGNCHPTRTALYLPAQVSGTNRLLELKV